MITQLKNMQHDITVFLTVSGGFLSWMAELDKALTTFLILSGLIYTIIRIVGKIKINKGIDLDNRRKELELKKEYDKRSTDKELPH